MIIKAIQTGSLIMLALLSAFRLSAQEQVGDAFQYSLVSTVTISMNSELTQGALVDVYWSGASPKHSGTTVTKLVAFNARLLSAMEVQPPQSVYPNTMQTEIIVELNAETIHALQSLPVDGRLSVVKSQ